MLVTGDFNAEHERWSEGKGRNCTNGIYLAEVADKYGYNISNTGEITHLPHFARARHTAIDVTLTTASLGTEEVEWTICDDPMGSDHLPQIITLQKRDSPHRRVHPKTQVQSRGR